MELLPPQNLDAERALLGSCLLSIDAFHDTEGLVTSADFYSDSHGDIYKAISKLVNEGQKPDAVAVANELENKGLLEKAGGAHYLGKILETVQHATHAEYYAQIVISKSKARNFIDICKQSMGEVYDGGIVEDVATVAEQHLHEIISVRGAQKSTDIRESLEQIFARFDSDESAGMMTGFDSIDRVYRLKPGHLTLIAGRPGHGKTAFAANLMVNIASTEGPVMFFSLEQSLIELTERLLASYSGVSHNKITKLDYMTEDERMLLLQKSGPLSDLPIWIDDDATTTIANIASKIRKQKRKEGLSLAIIDYLQLIEPEDRRIPREQQVAVMSRRLKNLAKQMDIPIVCLAQLNRLVTNRPNKRPMLSDLRESGSLEQDANAVLFVHRPEEYDPEDRPGEAEIILAKNRGGEKAIVPMQFEKKILTFRELSVQMPDHSDWGGNEHWDN